MILAIDLGTTKFKSALFNLELKRLGSHSLRTPTSHPADGRVEMEVAAVQDTIVDLIKTTCRQAGGETRAITSVAITSQAQCFTLLDDQGAARCPVISWLDGRAVDEARELCAATDLEWSRHCGFPAVGGHTPVAKLVWLCRNMPEVFEGNVHYVTLPGLVFHLLAGVHLTDRTQEALSGMYSLLDQEWLTALLAGCGLDRVMLPQCPPAGTSVVVRTDCRALDLRDEIALVPAGNDQITGAFGSACREGEVVVTLGSALAACRIAGTRPGPYGAGGYWGPYPGGRYYEASVACNGCRALDWARDALMPGSGAEWFDRAAGQGASSVTEATGIFRPDRMGQPDAWQGAFLNDDEKAYAVLEGLVFDLRKLVYKALACPRGVDVRVTGGGGRSNIFLQLIADGLGSTVSAGCGDGLLGAAAMAAGREVPDPDRRFVYPSFSRRLFFKLRRRQRDGNHRGIRYQLIQKVYSVATRICNGSRRSI